MSLDDGACGGRDGGGGWKGCPLGGGGRKYGKLEEAI